MLLDEIEDGMEVQFSQDGHPYHGRRGTVLATGAFNVFGKERIGARVEFGMAGPLVVEADLLCRPTAVKEVKRRGVRKKA